MRQPPSVRLPSYREPYGPRFVVMVLRRVVSTLLVVQRTGLTRARAQSRCSGLMVLGGVFLLVRAVRAGGPTDMAIGLNMVLLLAGASVLPLAGLPRHRRTREFRALYDAAHRQVVR